MIQNILVGLDESPYSDAAVELGLRWARRNRSTLVGLGIVDEPTICRPTAVGIGGAHYKYHRDEVLVADARRRVREILQRFTERCTAGDVSFRVLEETGLPSERILLESEDLDLTLLGKETHFHFETQSSADDTLDTVLRRSHRPVVAVPLEVPTDRSVVVAYDAGPPSVRALNAFQKSGLDNGQAVDVLSVANDVALSVRRAEEGAQFLRFHGMNARAIALQQTAPVAELILKEVQERNPSMLVMGAYGKSRLAEFFLGSTTRTLLRKSATLLFMHH